MKPLAIMVPFLSGGLFAAGLVVGGMTEPAKVIAFLDVTGAWNGTLAFVMAGAITIYFPLFRLITRRGGPLFHANHEIPMVTAIDLKLIAGAVLFGVGWGLVGFCPGPALASLSSSFEAALFVGCMLAGMAMHALVR